MVGINQTSIVLVKTLSATKMGQNVEHQLMSEQRILAFMKQAYMVAIK